MSNLIKRFSISATLAAALLVPSLPATAGAGVGDDFQICVPIEGVVDCDGGVPEAEPTDPVDATPTFTG